MRPWRCWPGGGARTARGGGRSIGKCQGKFNGEKERAYGNAAVAADNGDDDVRCGSGLANYFGDEGGGADDIESGHTEDPARGLSGCRKCQIMMYRLGS